MKVKSKEVARMLGVSAATVSLAINGKPGVNQETRQRIMDYISKTQGVSSADAQRVKEVTFVNSPRIFTPEMRIISKNSHMEGLTLLQKEKCEVIFSYAYGSEELKEILLDSNTDGTRGIIISADEFTETEYDLLRLCRIPFVLQDGQMRDPDWNISILNNRMAVFQGMKCLKEHGCRKVVYFRNTDTIYNYTMRRDAFTEYLKKDSDMEGRILDIGDSLPVMEERVTSFVEEGELPDAVFLENYLVSIGTVKTLEKLGICIPEGISLIGIDEIPKTVAVSCRLTHFQVPFARKGLNSSQMLLDRIRNPEYEYGECRMASLKFIEGDSIK